MVGWREGTTWADVLRPGTAVGLQEISVGRIEWFHVSGFSTNNKVTG